MKPIPRLQVITDETVQTAHSHAALAAFHRDRDTLTGRLLDKL